MEFLSGLYTYLQELNFASTALRMFLAVLCGGLIGLEREQKRLPAGFRTYMLVCLGAASAMLLGQYEHLMLATRWADTAALLGTKTDVARFGAQVINGIGFLGAGTILITGHQEVRGITTAAGLWASACMGLAIGAGFYECMIVGFILIYFSVSFFPRVENRLLFNSRNLNLYIEFGHMQEMTDIIGHVKAQGITVYDIEPGKNQSSGDRSAMLSLKLPKRLSHTDAIAVLAELPCIRSIDEV